MREIELSTMVRADLLNLDAFKAQSNVLTKHRQLDWTTGWSQILQIALYQKGPDLSEVGSTWLENLDSMRALRPYTRHEMIAFNGDSFLPNAWPPSDLGNTVVRTSIPWTLDTRMVHYRRDVLAKAGIQEEGAFATPEAFYDTLRRLRSAGHEYPFMMATGGLSIHNLACWIWGRGGHFRSPDLRKLTLVEPQARQGLVDYFGLHEFIDPRACSFNYSQADDWFYAGNSPVMFGGQWVVRLQDFNQHNVTSEVRENTWHALPPGIPYVGSTHLVVWKHTLHEAEVIDLIRHLTGPVVMEAIFNQSGVYPPRQDILAGAPFSTDPRSQIVVDCLRKGRGFRSEKLWAGVEMRLNDFSDRLWADLFAEPGLNLEAEVESRIKELANRLEKTLLAN